MADAGTERPTGAQADEPEYRIVVDPAFGYRRIDPMPTSGDLDRFYESSYRDLLDAGGRAPDLARLIAGGPDADAERTWQAATVHADVLAALEAGLAGVTGPILDVGCGTGELVRALAVGGWDAVGTEPAPEIAAVGRAAGLRVEVATSGAFVARWRQNEETAFAGIVLLNVLEHVPEPLAVLQDLTAALAVGGLLIVRVPNDYSPLQEAALNVLGGPEWWVAIPDHVNYFDHGSIARLVEGAGLTVIDRSADFPMELFLLMGDDYRGRPEVGRAVHERRRRAEMAMPSDVRRALGRAWAAAGIGRNATVVARRVS